MWEERPGHKHREKGGPRGETETHEPVPCAFQHEGKARSSSSGGVFTVFAGPQVNLELNRPIGHSGGACSSRSLSLTWLSLRDWPGFCPSAEGLLRFRSRGLPLLLLLLVRLVIWHGCRSR